MKATVRTLSRAALGRTRYSLALRNAQSDAIAHCVGAGGIFEVRCGALPAGDLNADTGALLVALPLPADWAAPATDGTLALAAPLEGVATGAGIASHFRILTAAGQCCVGGPIVFNGEQLPDDPVRIDALSFEAGNR